MQIKTSGNQSKSPFLSVVISTYNRETVLCRTIKNVLEQSYPAFELIIVDQTAKNSRETQAFLTSLPNDKVRIISIARPSLPNARNIGAQMASGDIVVYIDDDVLLEPGFLSAHAKSYLSPDVGGVGGAIIEPNNSRLYLHKIKHSGRLNQIQPISGDILQFAQGGNMSFYRNLIKKVGYFDPGFIGNAVREETDFCFRLRRLGYKIIYCPEAKLIHFRVNHGGCRSSDPLQGLYERLYNVMRFAQKHTPQDIPLVLITHILIAFKMAFLLNKQPIHNFLWLVNGLWRGYRSVKKQL
jgi:GT2 family glycosyltransferase